MPTLIPNRYHTDVAGDYSTPSSHDEDDTFLQERGPHELFFENPHPKA